MSERNVPGQRHALLQTLFIERVFFRLAEMMNAAVGPQHEQRLHDISKRTVVGPSSSISSHSTFWGDQTRMPYLQWAYVTSGNGIGDWNGQIT